MKRTVERKRIAFSAAIAAVTAGLLILLYASCGVPSYEENKLPAGMGAVQLNFSRPGARAAVPDDPEFTDFKVYALEFTRTGISGMSTTIYRNNINREEDVNLYVGTYTLTITAYKEGTYTNETTVPMGMAQAAAYYISKEDEDDEDIEIKESGYTNVDVVLKAFEPVKGTETGFLEWDIPFVMLSGIKIISDAKMTITRILPTGSPAKTINLTVEENTTHWKSEEHEELIEGYYYIDLAIEVHTPQVSQHHTYYSRHIVHIYRNMTTLFYYLFTCCGITEQPGGDGLGNEGGTDGKGEIPITWPTRTIVFDVDALDRINNAVEGMYLEIEFDVPAYGYDVMCGIIIYQEGTNIIRYGGGPQQGQLQWSAGGAFTNIVRIPIDDLRLFFNTYVNLPGTDYAIHAGTGFIDNLMIYTNSTDEKIMGVYLRGPD